MSKRKKPKSRLISELNVVPYIDVMLVLLIIFMSTAPMITYGVKIDLPKTANAKVLDSNKNEKPLVINIKNNKEIYIVEKNEEVNVDIKKLLIKLKAYQKTSPNKKAFIRADKDLPYGEVIKIMNFLKTNGIEELGLVTDKDS